MRSGECVKVLCDFNDINLFNIYFENDLSVDTYESSLGKEDWSRIYDHEIFYKSFDFQECFKTK